MTLSLGRMTVLVPDLDAARDFYTRGFGLGVLFDEQISPDFRALHLGNGRMGDPGVWFLEGEAVARPGDEPLLVLYSTDLDGDLAHLATELAVVPFHGPDGDPGARFAHVRDPWHHHLVIAEKP